ncbi:glycosyltransferase family 2 protein [Brachybacterium ginsengisoli]|uniref:glycosyltransferase family 2 protein n=1 Tax=Brachybacterium ginsengisoli TaxID=1331682 RepID=UPI00223DADD5|nr:glycosyltransferase family 2 protein [Brachybacterium ginsengisoli]
MRDDAEHLRRLLADLSEQTTAPDEVIVVDNGSRDESALLARRAGCVVVHETAPGIPAAAAAGYDAARGDLILRCDADSRLPARWISAHLRSHSLAPDSVVLVTGPASFVMPRPWGALAAIVYLGAYMACAGAALGHLPAFGTTMSMRRVWWERVRGEVSLSAEVHDDMDLSFRVAPDERVRWAWGVRVGMSPRALRPGRLATLRGRRAVSTLRRNWVMQRPWERWGARLGLCRADRCVDDRSAAPRGRRR